MSPMRGQAYRNAFGKLPNPTTPGDQMLDTYVRVRTAQLAHQATRPFRSLAEWEGARPHLRRQLFEMLGLDPIPPKTNLNAVITGTLEHPEFTVEKIHFQSRPGLYVTGNVYLPKGLEGPAPAILYVCGHGQVKKDGISCGNKVTYQHHGAWFARNGYVCLVIDTVQLGEIEGIHHGTYREGMWWWNSRGYSSAAAEAWNCIRALDYLQSRTDVDGSRLGVTGRSGGGAYSWWVAALDERIAAACPVAGITDLQNHVVDGCVEGHCDCMYPVNTYRWDFHQIAALVAPRPLLLCNTDKDVIFPLDGVARTHLGVRPIYDLYDSPEKLGLVVTEGGHIDSQELQVPVMRWFNQWLKREKSPILNAAEPFFTPEQLKVFDTLPKDEITSRCYEDFTQLANESNTLGRESIVASLRAKTFGAWPMHASANSLTGLRRISESEADGLRLTVYEYESQESIVLRLYAIQPIQSNPSSLVIHVVDPNDWREWLSAMQTPFRDPLKDECQIAQLPATGADDSANRRFEALAQSLKQSNQLSIFMTPRGVGLSALSDDLKYQTQMRRRLMLLGETLASGQVWDVVQASKLVRAFPDFATTTIHWKASIEMTEVAAFATLMGPPPKSLTIAAPPRTDRHSPDFLNWSRILTPKQLLGLMQSTTQVIDLGERSKDR